LVYALGFVLAGLVRLRSDISGQGSLSDVFIHLPSNRHNHGDPDHVCKLE